MHIQFVFQSLSLCIYFLANEENPNREERDPSEFADARIDIRKLAQLLLGQQVNPVKVICSKLNGWLICDELLLISLESV